VSLCAEEVIEDRRVQRLDTLLIEVVVVSLDLGALAIMGLRHKCFNKASVLFRVLTHFDVILYEVRVALGSEESIELLLLVTETVLFNHQFGSQVHQ